MDAPADPDFMMSLSKGLAVLRCFADERRPMTIARASERTGLSRASVRRCLRTLVRLGYAKNEAAAYALQPSVMALGYAYLSSNSLAMTAQPVLDRITRRLGESCSLGVREGDEIWYAARSEATRIMSIALRVGSRLPLYCTSMGRVVLANQTGEQRQAYLDRIDLNARTPHTITDRARLSAMLDTIRAQGFAIVDQELEVGLRSIAVPVFGRTGSISAAINIGTQAISVSVDTLRERYLPELRKAATELKQYGQ